MKVVGTSSDRIVTINSVVPEPTSVISLAVGMVCLSGWILRRHKGVCAAA
jgi:hypothetical protein